MLLNINQITYSKYIYLLSKMITELTVSISLISLIMFLAKRTLTKPATPPLLEPNWTPDQVYLAQFPPSPHVRSISPFSLKLETWLRLTGVSYQNIYTRKFSKPGHTIPYIEINGEQVADSGKICETLKKHFKINPDAGLTASESAIGHAVTAMVEHHTAQIGFWWRYGLKMEDFACQALSTWKSTFAMRWFMPMGMRLKGRLCVFGRLDTAEVMEMSFRDIDALSELLGDKPYMFGNFPTSLDCMVFGHMAQFLYIPIGFPQEKYIKENANNLAMLVERIKAELWPDWEELCSL